MRAGLLPAKRTPGLPDSYCAVVALDTPSVEDYDRPHPHMLRHTFVATMPDAGVDLRDVPWI
jgi:site-specific recombinase XerD